MRATPIGGTTYYAYDGNGNVTSKTDPRGITTSMGYDALNRIVAKSYSDGTPGVTYCYDGNVYSGGLCVTASPPVSNPLGNLTQVYSSASTTSYSAYDALGRVQVSTQQTPAVNGMSFSFGAVGQPGYSYNLAGEITSTTYPSGRQVSYDYDNAGRTAHVRDPRAVGIAFADLSSNPSLGLYAYAPHGGVQFLTLGNGVTENTIWDPGRLQPHQITAAGSNSQSLLSLQYSFCQSGTSCTNNNGNVWQQTIATPAATRVQTYGYDGFNRLISAQESTTQGSPWSQNYQYGASGNRAVVSGYLPYPSLTPSAISQYSENYGNGTFNRNHWTGATYDSAGNMTGIPGASRSFTYDAENRITSASEPAMGAIAYTYDGDGRRVTKTVAGAVTTFVYDAQGEMVAEYGTVLPDMGTKYLTADMLGSTRLVTDPTGIVALKRYDYYPFGEDLQQGTGGRDTSYAAGIYPGVPDTEAMKFTGKERDAETGLDFFGARYLSGAMGRFTSPDKPFADQAPANPQSWILYGYGRNNPLGHNDPTGRKCVTVTSGSTKAQADDGSGGGCSAADVDAQGNITPQVEIVNALQGSLWALLTAPQIPRYVPNDRPLDEKGQIVTHELSKRIGDYPTVCGGGGHLYAGKEFSAGPVSGFAGGIKEFDSRSGSSQGALFELGGGEGYVAGVGYIGTVNGKGQAESSSLGYAGVGAHSPVGAGSVGLVGFNSGIGVYGDAFLFGRGGGGGLYINISSVARCR